MDFSGLDAIGQKLVMLLQHVRELKEENRLLKRKIYGLELSLNQAKASAQVGVFDPGKNEKQSQLIEERDRLMMERELIRKKVQGMLEKVDTYLVENGEGGDE